MAPPVRLAANCTRRVAGVEDEHVGSTIINTEAKLRSSVRLHSRSLSEAKRAALTAASSTQTVMPSRHRCGTVTTYRCEKCHFELLQRNSNTNHILNHSTSFATPPPAVLKIMPLCSLAMVQAPSAASKQFNHIKQIDVNFKHDQQICSMLYLQIEKTEAASLTKLQESSTLLEHPASTTQLMRHCQ